MIAIHVSLSESHLILYDGFHFAKVRDFCSKCSHTVSDML